MPVVAIPAVAVACLALLALLVLWGAKAFGQALATFIPKDLPVLGDRLHNLVLAFVAVAEAGVGWVMAALIRPAIGFVLGPVYRLIDFVDAVYYLARTTAVSWSWLLNSAIPSVIRKLEGYAHALAAAARAYALSLYRQAISYAATLYHRAISYAATLYHRAISYAETLYHRAVTYALNLVRTETAARVAAVAAARIYARDIAGAVSADLGKAVHLLEGEIKAITSTVIPEVGKAIAAGVSEAEAFATTAAANAVGVLTTDVDQAVAAVFDGLIIDVGALEGVIATDLPDIGAAVRAIPRAIPTDIAGAIGLSLAIERATVRYMKECGVPNCKRLGGLGRFLEDLLDAGSLGLLLAMLVKIVEDPEGAAQETADDLSGILGSATDLVSGLLGV